MTTSSHVFKQAKVLENTQTTQYTSTNCKSIVDGASVTNTGALAQTISVNLVASGDSSSGANLIVQAKSIAPGECYLLPEVRGRRFDAGDFLSTIASDAVSLVFRIEGAAVHMIDVEHHFLPGLYLKRTLAKAGTLLTQHRHTYAHASHLTVGTARVRQAEGEWVEHQAPATLLIPANMEHQVLAVTGIEWYCAHATPETDSEKIDESLIQK